MAQKYLPEFEKRNVKIAGLSCDPVKSHLEWTRDIGAYAPELQLGDAGKLSFPIVADPDRKLAVKLGMLDPDKQDEKGIPQPCRAVFLVDPAKKMRLSILYPASTGRNFDEIIRVIDSVQLLGSGMATPANWKVGDACVVASSVAPEDIPKKFPDARLVEMPSGKKYLRFTDMGPKAKF